jgi:hypothetical protein
VGARIDGQRSALQTIGKGVTIEQDAHVGQVMPGGVVSAGNDRRNRGLDLTYPARAIPPESATRVSGANDEPVAGRLQVPLLAQALTELESVRAFPLLLGGGPVCPCIEARKGEENERKTS